MNPRIAIAFILIVFGTAASAAAQASDPDGQATARTPSSVILPSAMLNSVLSDVQNTTSSLNVSHWKAPSRVKQATQEDVGSIQRDIGDTLPGLISRADSAPAAVSPSFAVYRNLEALYDVLLRVSETADLAAPDNEASAVSSSLQRLESARSQMADAILNNSQHNEAQIVALEAAVKAAKAAPAVRTHETVVDDGSSPKAPAKHVRKKTTPKKKAPSPSQNPPAGGTPKPN